MHAANNRGIKILGAVAITYTGESKSGLTLNTRQITYVTDSTDKVFLSRDACVELGMISKNFPAIGEMYTTHASPVMSSSVSDKNTAPSGDSKYAPCGCLKREAPPPSPTKLSFHATEENRKRLEQYLLDYYKSSIFNKCEHQPLPMMEVPPLRLMVDPTAKPVAYHKPIPIPLHWQDEIKPILIKMLHWVYWNQCQ